MNCLDSVNSADTLQLETMKDRQIALYYCKGGGGQFGHLNKTEAVKKTVATAKEKKKRGLN